MSATDWRLTWDDDLDRRQEKLVRWKASLRAVGGVLGNVTTTFEFGVFSGEVVSVWRR